MTIETNITERELDFYETLHYPVALAECLFSGKELEASDNLAIFNEDFAEIRLHQYPLLSFEYLLGYDSNLSAKENFQLREGAATIYVLGGRKYGKCEYENNAIQLANGEVKLAKELIGKTVKVISFNDQTWQLETSFATFYNNGRKPCKKIILKSGKEIIITENHPLYTNKGWMQAKDLNNSYFLATPRVFDIQGELDVPETHAALLGYLLGDGCCTHQIGFTNINQELINEFKNIVKDFNCSIRKQDITYWVRGNNRQNKINDFVKYYSINKLSKEKRIPREVFIWKNKYLKILINRLFACDAHVNYHNNSVEFTSASQQLVLDVSSILLRFGIHSYIIAKDIYQDNKHFKAWRLFIAQDVNKFMDIIGIKTKDSKKIRNKLYSTSDLIPKNFISKIYQDLPYKKELNLRKLKQYNPSRNKCELLENKVANIEFSKIVQSNIYWDRIREVVDFSQLPTVAVSVPKNNTYISNNIISHNTLCVEKIDLCLAVFLLGAERIGFTSMDAMHIRGVLEDVIRGFEQHPILKQLDAKVNRSPTYRITFKKGTVIEGINMNLAGKKPGEQFFQKHLTRLYIEEASFEDDTVYKKRIDSVSENGCIVRAAGMTNFTKHSPVGRIFYDLKNQPRIVNLPQKVSPKWGKKENLKALKEHGGEQSISYRVFVNGEVVEEGVSVIDMERVRRHYKENKEIQHLEVTKDNFHNFEEILIVHKYKNASSVYITADIGESAPTEIAVLFEVPTQELSKYHYAYNITLYNLTDKQQFKVFKYLAEQLNANFVGIDTTDGTGRAIYRSLEEVIPKNNLVWVHFAEKLPVGFEKDKNGEVVFKNGIPVQREEYVSEWSIKHLKNLLYDGRIPLPIDYRLDVQLNSLISMQSGARTIYTCVSEEDHLLQAFQVFSIAQWKNEFNQNRPCSRKKFSKKGVF